MGKKFDSIFESVVSRYNLGGYLPGDIVKFKPDYKSSDTYKAMHSAMKAELDELVNSGLNIKVVQVGDRMNGTPASYQHKKANDAVITVAGDHGGGRYYGSITVCPMMIDIADVQNPTPGIPDQWRRDDDKYLNGKAEEWKADQQNITRVTDKGNGKNTPTDLKLAGESTRHKRDAENMAMLYEETLTPIDYTAIYEKVLIEEGLLRRMATTLSGGFKSNPLQLKNKAHQFAKSVAYDVAKDVSKTFGGDIKQHTRDLYQYIFNYVQKSSTIP